MTALRIVRSSMAATFALSTCFGGLASACTIGEEARAQFPLNTSVLSNADRLTIAGTVAEAKNWPDVQIQAVVIAGAYIGERNIERLKDARAETVQAYLEQLGVKRQNILIDKKTFTDAMVTKGPGNAIHLHQVIVELTPICEGSCASLCDDPRVRPHSKAVGQER
ncbi:hypothetical protein LMG22037_05221 [Paraburkholderia phenoliruptrix]|uniref:OmpA-like domain-containing protein n=2 Tax=Paraburkholderia phenoliruptrix TaxID=252970 RepID=A0A6J5C8B0_9BURK|nr:hypothetical protein LMG22037_05221 [Paraburkholderia phenoliruptrix]